MKSTDEDKVEKIAEYAKKIEKDLEVIAITAIEDRLQDQVPETITSLKNAGISFWMLTGDKTGTAINIGKSCNLLSEDQDIHQILEPGQEQDKWKLMQSKNPIITEYEKKGLDNLSSEEIVQRNKILAKNAVVVNGASLEKGISEEL